MSKHAVLPTSRLICFGGAKACTNAIQGDTPENDVGDLYFPS
jgi:hypothetical protein